MEASIHLAVVGDSLNKNNYIVVELEILVLLTVIDAHAVQLLSIGPLHCKHEEWHLELSKHVVLKNVNPTIHSEQTVRLVHSLHP